MIRREVPMVLRALAVLVLVFAARAHAALPDGGVTPDALPDAPILVGDGGVVIGSGLVVSPTPVDFGTVPLNMPQSRPVTLDNTEPLLAIDVTGFVKPNTTDCVPFSVAPDQPLPETLGGNTQRTWTAGFKPLVAGTYDCTIQVFDTDGDLDVIHLVGTGGAPQLSVNPTMVAFGNVATSAFVDQTVTLTNVGLATLSISGIGLMPGGPPFALPNAPTAFPVVLAPGDSIAFDVRFSPTAVGTFSAALVVTSNDPSTPMRMIGVSGNGVAPGGGVLTMAPSPVTFGPIGVGNSANATLTLGNAGAASLDVAGMAITGSAAADFQFSDVADGCVGGQTCLASFTINVAASHPVPLACTPSATGTRLATLTVTSAAAGTKTVTLSCDATGPVIALSPSSIQFGTIRVNTTSGQQLDIANSGNSDLHVASVTLAGANPGDYAVVGSCAAGCTIPAATSRPVSIDFTPTARGPRPATVAVASDDPSQPTTFVELDGTGGAGVLAITVPASADLDFGQIPIATTSSPSGVTIQNQGELSLTIASATAAPAIYTRAGQATPLTIAPGATATWPVTCTPTAAATVDGALTITSDALANAVQSVALHCTGTTSTLVADPSPLGFGGVRTDRTATHAVTVTNIGAVAVTIDHVAASMAVYSASPVGALPRTLQQNQSLTVDVTFAPTAEAAYPDTLRFVDGGGADLATVALSGDGHVPAYAIAPTTIDFGMRCVGQAEARDVVVSNAGTATIRITQTAITGAGFSIASGDVGLGLELAPTQSRTLTVVAQAASGNRSGSLGVVTDLTTGGAGAVALSIDGLASGVVANPSALDFPTQASGSTSDPQTVEVVNCDTAALAIDGVAITGVNAADFNVSGPASGSIAVAGNAVWSVRFAPTFPGLRSATLVIATGGAPIMVPLTGTGASIGDDGGLRADAGGAGEDTTSYYACACRGPGDAGAVAPLALAVVLVLRRRRR